MPAAGLRISTTLTSQPGLLAEIDPPGVRDLAAGLDVEAGLRQQDFHLISRFRRF